MTTNTQFIFLLCLGFGFLACSQEPDVPPAPPDRYRVRGIVRQLPQRPGGEVYVHHEAIPSFKSSEGEVVGMESMAMPFPLAEGALPEGVAPGDRVEMEFEVRWDADSNPLLVTSLEELPPDTRLEFELRDDGEAGDEEGGEGGR